MDGIDVDHEPVMKTNRARKAPLRFREPHRACRRLCGLSQADLGAIDSIIAHCDAWSFWCSNTIRTARFQISGENFVALLMA
ncbi:MAG: hypothetical protein WBN85_08165, partial [Candidatus Macondimonas sp.]